MMVNCVKCIFAIQLISSILGITINLLIITVRLLKYFQHKKISSYHYIILNIAFADIVYASFMIFDMETTLESFHWKYSLTSCKIVRNIQVAVGDIPALFIVLLAYERYQGIKTPFSKGFRVKSVIMISLFMWVFAFCGHFPYIFKLVTTGDNDKRWCIPGFSSTEYSGYYFYCVFAIFFAIPFLATIILHYRMFSIVRLHNTRLSKLQFGSKRKQIKKTEGKVEEIPLTHTPSMYDKFLKQIVKPHTNVENAGDQKQAVHFQRRSGKQIKVHILVSISILFFVCMFPVHLYFLLSFHQAPNLNNLKLFTWFKYFHCFVNGIVYSVFDRVFRFNVLMLVKSIVTCQPHFINELKPSALNISPEKSVRTNIDSN